MKGYQEFLDKRAQAAAGCGFTPSFLPDFLYEFQRDLVEWSVERGRAAIFADCGLGKTPMQLVWAENVVRKTNKPVLITTPLAVSYQLLEEAEKFGIEAIRSTDGGVPKGARIVATNYERLEKFDPSLFAGMVCDESSILKNFNGVRRKLITEFLRTLPYRLLCTATAAPNDYTELGTSSEALGELGHMDMLHRFFKNDRNVTADRGRHFGRATEWRFKGHAEEPFWRWVSSWSRVIRRPSDYGYEDGEFVLPPLEEREHIMPAHTPREGLLFNLPAVSLAEQREERRRTIDQRCERVAELVNDNTQSLVWCHLNKEGDKLTGMIDGAIQVKGSDSDDAKEERLLGFAHGEIKTLVTKPKIGAWGLNLQRCSHVTFFPSHSYEQYYQGVRRCWRFGQHKPVIVDIVATDGERRVIDNLKQKAKHADRMFDSLLQHMQDVIAIKRSDYASYNKPVGVPTWL